MKAILNIEDTCIMYGMITIYMLKDEIVGLPAVGLVKYLHLIQILINHKGNK